MAVPIAELPAAALTDKSGIHSYLRVYNSLLAPYRDSARVVCEIGVLDGGSLLLWEQFFARAEVHGFDVNDPPAGVLEDHPRIHFHKGDAYGGTFHDHVADGTVDVLIDDGPHSTASVLAACQIARRCLRPGGLFVVEDVQGAGVLPAVMDYIAKDIPELGVVTVYDLRRLKGRFDDILLVTTRL